MRSRLPLITTKVALEGLSSSSVSMPLQSSLRGSEADPRLSTSAAAAPAAAVLPVLQGGRAYRFASGILLRLHAKREREQSQQPQRPWLLGGKGPRPAMCHPGNFTAVPWGAFREDAAPAPGSAGFGSGSLPAAALFTPYHVTTGGGEKYLLSGR